MTFSNARSSLRIGYTVIKKSINRARAHYFPILFLLVFVSCAPQGDGLKGIGFGTVFGGSTGSTTSTSGVDINNSSSDSIAVSPGGNSATGENDDGDIHTDTSTYQIDTGTHSDGDSINGGSIGPVTSIPLPELQKGLLSKPDISGTVAYQAQEGAFDSNYGAAVVNVSKIARWQDQQHSFFAKVTNWILDKVGMGSKSIRTFIPLAHAESASVCFNPDYYTILTVNEDGSVDPTAIAGHVDGDTYEIFQFDPATCEEGTAVADTVLENVLFLAQAPVGGDALAIASSDFYQLNEEGKIAQFSFSDEEFTVQGNFDDAYEFSTTNPDYQSYRYSDGEYIFQDAEALYSYSDPNISTLLGNSKLDCDPASGCTVALVKSYNEYTYYTENLVSPVALVDLNRYSSAVSNDYPPIHLMSNSNIDDDPTEDLVASIEAFDVGFESTTNLPNQVLAAFTDDDDKIRLIGIWGKDSTELTEDSPALTGFYQTSLADPYAIPPAIDSVQDIIIYNAQLSSDLENGLAMMRVNTNIESSTVSNKVIFFEYDLIDTGAECTDPESEEWEDRGCDDITIDSTQLNFTSVTVLSIDNIIALILNESKTTAYALADNAIHVIDLATKSVSSVLDIKVDLLGGKDMEFAASSLKITKQGEREYLLISDDRIRSVIVNGL